MRLSHVTTPDKRGAAAGEETKDKAKDAKDAKVESKGDGKESKAGGKESKESKLEGKVRCSVLLRVR